MDAWRCGTCVVRMRTTGRKTLVNSQSRRTVVRYDMNGNRDGSMAGSTRGWASWRAASLRTGLDLERPYDRTTVRPDTNVLRPVVRMRTTQMPHRQASTSRHVSDQAFPELSNFFACYVARVRGKAWERG